MCSVKSNFSSKCFVASSISLDKEPTRNAIIFISLNLAHNSVVNPHSGSWLIQTMMTIFRQYHQQKSVRDLLCELNHKIRAEFTTSAQRAGKNAIKNP